MLFIQSSRPFLVEADKTSLRSGIQKTKLTHVERTQQPQQEPKNNSSSFGFNSNLVDGLLRLRKDIDSSSSLSEGWDEDEDSDEQ